MKEEENREKLKIVSGGFLKWWLFSLSSFYIFLSFSFFFLSLSILSLLANDLNSWCKKWVKREIKEWKGNLDHDSLSLSHLFSPSFSTVSQRVREWKAKRKGGEREEKESGKEREKRRTLFIHFNSFHTFKYIHIHILIYTYIYTYIYF